MISKKNFIKNLRILGYRYLNLRNQKKLIKNFQRKYRPKIVSGNLDHETYEISEFLTKKSK